MIRSNMFLMGYQAKEAARGDFAMKLLQKVDDIPWGVRHDLKLQDLGKPAADVKDALSLLAKTPPADLGKNLRSHLPHLSDSIRISEQGGSDPNRKLYSMLHALLSTKPGLRQAEARNVRTDLTNWRNLLRDLPARQQEFSEKERQLLQNKQTIQRLAERLNKKQGPA